jgi:hypothetical protein
MPNAPEPGDVAPHLTERERAIGAVILGVALGLVLRLVSRRSSV